MEKPSYLGHRERIRNKFRAEGLDPFLDHEILELLLTFSVPRKDTKKLAWSLIKSFGSFNNVLEASDYNLRQVKGVGPQSALLVNLIKDIMVRYNRNKLKERRSILNQEQLYDYVLSHLQEKKTECFEVLFLDIKLKLIATEILVEGDVDKATIPIRKLMELVLKHGAKSIICVHNHPSGDPTPSDEDIAITQRIKDALDTVSTAIADHIIVGAGKLYSLRSKAYLRGPKILL